MRYCGKRPALPLLLLATLCTSCGSDPEQRTRPIAGPTPITPDDPLTDRTIRIGEVVEGFFVLQPHHFDVTPAVGGMLVVTLTWDHLAFSYGLELSYQGQSVRAVEVGGGKRVYEIAVSAGQTYRLTVIGSGNDLTYDMPYVLTTRLRP